MKKFITILLFLALPVVAFAQFFYSSPGGGGGSVLPVSTAFGQFLIGDGTGAWRPSNETSEIVWNATDGLVLNNGGVRAVAINSRGPTWFNDNSEAANDFGVKTKDKPYGFFVDSGVNSVGMGDVPAGAAMLESVDTTRPQYRLKNGTGITDFKVNSSGNFFAWPTGLNIFWGTASGQLYAGTGAVGYGTYTLFNAIGDQLVAVGPYAGQSVNGKESTMVGYAAGYQSYGVGLSAFGSLSCRDNIGSDVSAFGIQSGFLNAETNGTFFSSFSGYQNTGVGAVGFGRLSLRYNDSDYAGAFGGGAWSAFASKTSGNKTFAFSDVNVTTDRVTVLSHGFGSVGEYKNILYTQGTGPITPLITGTVYQIKIIDSNTIGFNELSPGGFARGKNITNAGTGTGHVFTPQNEYPQTIAIGNNSLPDRANTIYFGGDHTGGAYFDHQLDAKMENITSVISPPALIADVNNWNPTGLSTCRIIRLSASGGNQNISGIQAIPGRVITMTNVGTGGNIVLLNRSALSSAPNRFLIPSNQTLQTDESTVIWYDDIDSGWRIISHFN